MIGVFSPLTATSLQQPRILCRFAKFAAAALTSNAGSSGKEKEWRKQQLELLEQRMQSQSNQVDHAITNDDDLQPMWRNMENRVTRRQSRVVDDKFSRTGRVNIKRTDEEVWLEQGLYGGFEDDKNTK